MDSYIQFESYETYLLYEEFQNIQGNRIELQMKPGYILTTEQMHNMLMMAYRMAGHKEMLIQH